MLQISITIMPAIKDIAAAWEKQYNTVQLVGCSCNNQFYFTGLVQVQQTAQMAGYC